MNQEKIAMVTGANRGIGFETVKQLSKRGIKVILTARYESKGKKAYETLKKQTSNVFFHQLDVTDHDNIKKLYDFVQEEFGRLDILINNAAICIDKDKDTMNIDIETFRKTMETNLYGPILLCQAFIPLMKKNNYGRIVNVSSGMGQLKSFVDMGEKPVRCPIYRISKTALNSLTRILSYDVQDYNILVNSVNPGWVKTEMGGPGATRRIEESTDTIVWLATLPDDGPKGCFFKDKQVIEW